MRGASRPERLSAGRLIKCEYNKLSTFALGIFIVAYDWVIAERWSEFKSIFFALKILFGLLTFV
jgi:hypothetical protein